MAVLPGPKRLAPSGPFCTGDPLRSPQTPVRRPGLPQKGTVAAMNGTDHFRLRSVTRRNIPYCIGWVVVFVWLYAYFLPFGGFRFESELYNLKVADKMLFTLVWLVVTPLVTALLDGRSYVPATWHSVVGAIAGFAALRFTPAGPWSNAVLALGSACIGHIFASCCYAFFMVLNNTEKFYSMLLAVVLPKLLLAAKPVLNQPQRRVDGANYIILTLLLVLLVCAWLFRRGIAGAPARDDLQPPARAYWLMPLVFAVLCLNDVVAPSVIQAVQPLAGARFEPWYLGGVMLGAGFILLFEKFRRAELYHVLNLSFACGALGFAAAALGRTAGGYLLLAFVLLGLSYALGLVNIYYLAGFMAKRFQSARFYRIGIALSSAYYLAGILVVRLLGPLDAGRGVETIAFVSVVLLVLFLFLTPFFIRNLSAGEWMDDTYREDITRESRLEARLRDFRLSPRERETCRMLLEGYTLRQIAAVMGISFSTVNTYCNSIYKKLNINSRTELSLLLRKYVD